MLLIAQSRRSLICSRPRCNSGGTSLSTSFATRKASVIKLRASCNLDIRHLLTIFASLTVLEHRTGQMSVNSFTFGRAPRTGQRSPRIDEPAGVVRKQFTAREWPAQRLIRSPRWRDRGQVLADLRQELTRAVGLGNVAVATRRTGLVIIASQSIGGDGDDRNGMQHCIGLETARRLVAVHDR